MPVTLPAPVKEADVQATSPVIAIVLPVCSAVATVAVAALPEVSWLPDVLTPGKLIEAEPSKDTQPIFIAVASVVAVLALPVTAPSTFATKVATA